MSIKVKARRKARFHAVQALYQEGVAHTELNHLKAQFYADNVDRHPVDWDFFNRILDGVIKNRELIDTKITQYAVNDIDSINPIELAVLRLGAYELLDCLDVPYPVVLNEYVDQAKTLGSESGHGFVNGLLDKLVGDFRQEARNSKTSADE